MKVSYREYLKLNKNLLISFIIAFTMSATVAQFLAEEESYVNSSYTVVVDFTTFYSSFSILFYIDNRKKYRKNDRTDTAKLKKDLIKIISSVGIGEIIYMAARWYLQYYFLTLEYEPYLASAIAHLLSYLVYMIVVNLSVKFTRLYKHDA